MMGSIVLEACNIPTSGISSHERNLAICCSDRASFNEVVAFFGNCTHLSRSRTSDSLEFVRGILMKYLSALPTFSF